MSRRAVTWLLILPLAIVGSQVGHALAYHLVTPDAGARTHELAATGHGYLDYAPLGLAVCTVVVMLALAAELRHVVNDGHPSNPRAITFAVLAPAIFSFQEHFERLLHDGGFPWGAALEPTFVAGLLLQVPFAAAAYLLARLLLRVVRSLGRLIASPSRARDVARAISRPAARLAPPRVPVLALGYASRGPPPLRS